MYRFYSSPSESSKVRVTVVGEYDVKDHALKIAVARCGRKDNFIKKKGRAIAEGRLVKNKLYYTYDVTKAPKSEEFVSLAREIAISVANNPSNLVINTDV
jgi:hypothetical protein